MCLTEKSQDETDDVFPLKISEIANRKEIISDSLKTKDMSDRSAFVPDCRFLVYCWFLQASK